MKLKSMVKRVLKKVGIIPDKRSAKQAKGAKEKNGATPQELSEAELERLALEAEEKARQEAEKEELEAVIQRYAEFDRDHVWARISGEIPSTCLSISTSTVRTLRPIGCAAMRRPLHRCGLWVIRRIGRRHRQPSM